MEQEMQIVAKKFLKIFRVAYFMFLKGIISKGKMFSHLNLFFKRISLAGKLEAVYNLMFHHHTSAGARRISLAAAPANPDRNRGRQDHSKAARPPMDGESLAAALEFITSSTPAAASPVLPGFGPSPMVRKVRITDSPFPLWNSEEDDDHVDAAAEEFIARFYSDMKKQNTADYLAGYWC